MAFVRLGLVVLLVAFSIAAFPGCASNRVDNFKPDSPVGTVLERKGIAGRWYGESATKEGGSLRWLRDAQEDGTFSIKFKATSADGKVEDRIEAGIWGYSAGIYFTATREIWDGTAFRPVRPGAYFDDAYRIESFTADSMTYTSLETGNRFKVKRVPSTFAL
jgi:hypothetical protein